MRFWPDNRRDTVRKRSGRQLTWSKSGRWLLRLERRHHRARPREPAELLSATDVRYKSLRAYGQHHVIFILSRARDVGASCGHPQNGILLIPHNRRPNGCLCGCRFTNCNDDAVYPQDGNRGIQLPGIYPHTNRRIVAPVCPSGYEPLFILTQHGLHQRFRSDQKLRRPI